MTYHEFLKAVWRGANKPGQLVTGESFDNALVAALHRMDPELHQAAMVAVATVDKRTKRLKFSTTDMLKYLERSWKVPATT